MKSVAITLNIIKALTNSSLITAEELARQCEVSTRTIYRYIDEVTVCGLPINTRAGNKGGIYLDEEYKKRNYNYIVKDGEFQRKKRYIH